MHKVRKTVLLRCLNGSRLTCYTDPEAIEIFSEKFHHFLRKEQKRLAKLFDEPPRCDRCKKKAKILPDIKPEETLFIWACQCSEDVENVK